MKNCPSCGSSNIYIHDKGFKLYWRILTLNNRLVCRECRTTWRRSSPAHFAKLKRKSHKSRIQNDKEYLLINADDALRHLEAKEVSPILSGFQEQKTLFLCLNLSLVDKLTPNRLQNLLKIFRRIRTLGGDLVVSNATPLASHTLISLNLTYLLATTQKVVETTTEASTTGFQFVKEDPSPHFDSLDAYYKRLDED